MDPPGGQCSPDHLGSPSLLGDLTEMFDANAISSPGTAGQGLISSNSVADSNTPVLQAWMPPGQSKSQPGGLMAQQNFIASQSNAGGHTVSNGPLPVAEAVPGRCMI